MTWVVTCKPIGRDLNAKRNDGGLAITLRYQGAEGSVGEWDSWSEYEVSRVGFSRDNSKNPDITFADQIQEELDKAYEAADVLNAALDEVDRAKEEERANAKARVREIMGPPPRGKKLV